MLVLNVMSLSGGRGLNLHAKKGCARRIRAEGAKRQPVGAAALMDK